MVDARPLQAASLLLLGPSADRQALEIALTSQLVKYVREQEGGENSQIICGALCSFSVLVQSGGLSHGAF